MSVYAPDIVRVSGEMSSGNQLGELSPRELEVLRLMADGLTNQEIASRLSLSPRTTQHHTSHILGKLGLARRTAVVAYAIRHGLA